MRSSFFCPATGLHRSSATLGGRARPAYRTFPTFIADSAHPHSFASISATGRPSIISMAAARTCRGFSRFHPLRQHTFSTHPAISWSGHPTPATTHVFNGAGLSAMVTQLIQPRSKSNMRSEPTSPNPAIQRTAPACYPLCWHTSAARLPRSLIFVSLGLTA